MVYELASWGQYPALIDNIEGNEVTGQALQIPTREQEEKLERYETDACRVHCCKYLFEYAGDAEALKAGRFDRKLWQDRMGQFLPAQWENQATNPT